MKFILLYLLIFITCIMSYASECPVTYQHIQVVEQVQHTAATMSEDPEHTYKLSLWMLAGSLLLLMLCTFIITITATEIVPLLFTIAWIGLFLSGIGTIISLVLGANVNSDKTRKIPRPRLATWLALLMLPLELFSIIIMPIWVLLYKIWL